MENNAIIRLTKQKAWNIMLTLTLILSVLLAGCAGETVPSQEAETEARESGSAIPPKQSGTEKPSKTPQKDWDPDLYVWNRSMGRYDDYPDDYFIKWALPDNEPACVAISGETLEAFNAKLEADGYSFGLKFVPYETGKLGAEIDAEAILSELETSNADIVTVTTDGLSGVAETVQAAGLFEPLDERLAGSLLYDTLPELCWESVRYQGTLCYVPNEYWTNSCMHLCVQPGQLPDESLNQFDGDIFKLGDYLSEETPMYYSACDFKFAETFGYAFDPAWGLLVAADGTYHDPLEDERVVEWLRTVNRWYHEGKVQLEAKKQEQCALSLWSFLAEDNWESAYVWKGYMFHRVEGPSGILAASGKKDEAFTLLELLHTDHSYGELLVYGKTALNTENPENGYARLVRSCLGLDTGLRWGGNWNANYFSNAEEKKRYYDENILPSPSLYTDITEHSSRLNDIEHKYLEPETDYNGKIDPGTSLFTCSNFDAMLEKFREELKEPMDEVLGKLAAPLVP